MPPMLRNVLAVLAGLVTGGAVNMGLLVLGMSLIPPPPGVDFNNPESLKANIHLFEPKHFVTPFLAHALGTFVGALAAWLLAVSNKAPLAWLIGAFFLCGGIAASFMIPAPKWFIALDLLAAYFPMAWLAIQAASRFSSGDSPSTPRPRS